MTTTYYIRIDFIGKQYSYSYSRHALVLIDNNDFSSSFPLEEMIEFCILDPEFPSFVAEVSNTLNKKLK